MKKLAGSLKLELAQYRESLSFAKFGSDMDEATQDLIKRGNILTELLKQNKYSPLETEKQILIIFAGINGYVNNIPFNEIKTFEKNLLEFATRVAFFKPFYKELAYEFDEEVEEALDFLLNLFLVHSGKIVE